MNKGEVAENLVSLPVNLFLRLLAAAVEKKNIFDENFYLREYSDIREALANKKIASAAEHYYKVGYFEGRFPREILIDETFYLDANPDVADAIRKGNVSSAQEHFNYSGFHDGRQPFRDFSLF